MDRQRLLGFSSDACLNALQVKVFFCTKMVVSENRGTPKSSILLRFSIITIHFGVLFFLGPPKRCFGGPVTGFWVMGDGDQGTGRAPRVAPAPPSIAPGRPEGARIHRCFSPVCIWVPYWIHWFSGTFHCCVCLVESIRPLHELSIDFNRWKRHP